MAHSYPLAVSKASSTRQASQRTDIPWEGSQVDLIPGVRNRLLARLAVLGVPQDRLVSHVAKLTNRAIQSVRRWFDPEVPGLPDLESFARLCVCLGCSANEIIGTRSQPCTLSKQRRHIAQIAGSVFSMVDALMQQRDLSVPMRVPGDEMAPYLQEGDLIIVDTSANCLADNGIYALKCNGKLIVRRAEQRLGEGFVLKCDNPAYRDQEIKNAAMAKHLGIKIIGKIHGVISARTF